MRCTLDVAGVQGVRWGEVCVVKGGVFVRFALGVVCVQGVRFCEGAL